MESFSFDIGESTLLEIEKQANRYQTPKTSRKSQSQENKNPDDQEVVEESPNAHICSGLSFKSLKNRSHVSKFSKSKSTSIVQSRKTMSPDDISSISRFMKTKDDIDIDNTAFQNSLAKLISPMIQRRENHPNSINNVKFKFDRSVSEAINGTFDDTVLKPIEENQSSPALISSQDYFSEDPLDTAITGDVDITFTEDLETSIRNVDHVTFIEPQDPANVQETQNFIDEILEDHKNNQKIQSESFNESILSLVSFSSQLNHETSLRVDMSKDLKYIRNWNLPKSIVNEYQKKNVIEMFDWQVECLQNSKVLFEGANLVYSAPTSAGKTLVSEILMIKSIVERKKKALFILPFVSVVREKMFYLQDLMTSSGIRVEGFFGGYHPPGGFENIDLAVCTIEKANSIINKLLEHDKLNTVGMIVIDEVHLISDSSRGYILELLLTKILYMCEKFQHQIQLVTMSATLPNVELLRKWLKAEFYSTDYRPVELREMIKIDKDIFDHKMQFLRKVDMSFEEFFEESGDVCLLAMETIMENCQLICFCPTKEWCSKLSLKLASGIHKLIQNRAEIMNQIVDQKRIQLLRGQLKSLPSGVDEELIRYTSCGVAFHHAGLTTDERDLVEMGFKDGILKALFATSTLSSGVNLPARRVIIRTPMFGYNKKMSNLTYRQMIGRAGRKGKDTKGESILCCTNAEVKFGKELVEAPLDPIKSCLDQDGHAHLKRALLEIIASGMANTKDDLEKFVNSTLFCQENDINYNYFENDHDGDEKISKKSLEDLNNEKTKEKSNDPIKSSMDFLIQYEFIRIHNDEENGNKKFVPTRLGLACLSSAIPPKDGFILFSELQKSRQNFVLESELHAVYLVTPFSVAYQLQNIDWGYFHDVFDKLPDMMKRVGHMVGVSDSYLIKAIMGKQSSDWKSQQIHKRFYTALALQELINEKSVTEVSNKYRIPRGLLQSLQQSAATFAGVVTTFCKSLDWNLLALILTQFRERLFFGIHPDLMDLMKIPSMSSTRIARALFKNGIEKLSELASAEKLKIENVLIDLGENFFVSGKSVGMNFQDMAKLLIQDARNYVQNENGLKIIQWSQVEESEQQQEIVQEKTAKRISRTTRIKRKAMNLTPDQISMDAPKRMKIPSSSRVQRKMDESVGEVNASLFQNSDLEASNHFTIIDLLASEEIFANYKNEILTETKEIGMSIGVSKMETPSQMIGGNLLQSLEHLDSDYNYVYDEIFYVDCLSLCIDNRVFYLNLQKCEQYYINEIEKIVNELFLQENRIINIFDARESLKILQKTFGGIENNIQVKIQDPKIANWLFNSEENQPWQFMIKKFIPEHYHLLEKITLTETRSSLGPNFRWKVDAKIRSSIESFLTLKLIEKQIEEMKISKIVRIFQNLEMNIQVVLFKMEICGFPINERKLYDMIDEGTSILRQLETHIYKLNDGIRFNLSSSKEVSKVLGIHRNQEKNKKVSTKKNILEKIDTLISKAIMQYRTLDKSLSNMRPKVKLVNNGRIYANSFSLTQTGRISMFEPNLQNVTKDFTVDLQTNDGKKIQHNLSFRSIFECAKGRVLLAADFCQLELRILTHLCKDDQLMMIMNTPGDDIFRMIAAKWNNIDESQVTDQQRNQTKQLCYGIIYGMGRKALAESMNVDEEKAAELSRDFHATYPGIHRFTEDCVKKTEDRGYCHTLTGRRRYLPNINSTISSEKSQAERQALNTCIQGTASDLVKNAIINMEKNLKRNEFHDCKLVLHLHDELFYEVNDDKVQEAAKLLEKSMENAVKLTVPLKVKIKFGRNWGELKELKNLRK